MIDIESDFVKARVWLEGVLFPYTKTISVMDSADTVRLQLEVPPSIKLKVEDWAGMTCHIFYANKRVVEKFGDASDDLPCDWPVLFQGELTGQAHNKSLGNESVMLDFTGHVKHFDQTILYFYDTTRDTPFNVMLESMFLGNTEIEMDFSGLTSRQTRILNTLKHRIHDFEESEDGRNIAFSSVVLELLREARNRHISFKIFDDKFKLTNRFAAYSDPDIKELLSLEVLKNLVDDRTQSLSTNTPLTRMLEIATDIMRYNWINVTQPQLRLTGEAKMQEDESGIIEDEDITVDAAVRILRDDFILAGTNISSIVTQFGEIKLPSDFSSRYREIDMEVFITNVKIRVDAGESPQEAIQFLVSQRLFPGPAFSGDIEEVVTDIQGRINDLESESLDTNTEDLLKDLEVDQSTLATRDELNEFMVVPNMQFSQPPKCNVILPHTFNGYGMSRNHSSEVTRLYGRVDFVPGANETLTEWYLAPSTQSYYYVDNNNVSKFTSAYQDFYDALVQEDIGTGEE